MVVDSDGIAVNAPRRGDSIPVMVEAADGPVVVWHTPEEYAALWRGVDRDVVEAMEQFR
jgi:hypothetical protein